VVVGTVVFCGIPLLLHALRRPNWVKADPGPESRPADPSPAPAKPVLTASPAITKI